MKNWPTIFFLKMQNVRPWTYSRPCVNFEQHFHSHVFDAVKYGWISYLRVTSVNYWTNRRKRWMKTKLCKKQIYAWISKSSKSVSRNKLQIWQVLSISSLKILKNAKKGFRKNLESRIQLENLSRSAGYICKLLFLSLKLFKWLVNLI